METPTRVNVPLLLLVWLMAPAAAAHPRFAEPPPEPEPEPYETEHAGEVVYPPTLPSSTVRLGVGPALRIARYSVDGGLEATADIGSRAAGARLSGSWVRAGSEDGLSQYTAELWIDFGAERRLHPILGAGAGLARLDAADETGATTTSTMGIGVLRGTLEYVLPVFDADARAGLSLLGAVPAIRKKGTPETNGWLLVGAHVAVGF